jgi:uncharacterized membrane protein YcaP (DUF421 family)
MGPFLTVLTNAAIVFFFIILYTRIFGLRSFSKMSNFDFAITIAIGSLISSTIINTKQSVFVGLLALLALYFLKVATAFATKKFSWLENAISNQPVLLMENGEILHHALKQKSVTENELMAKLREANVLDLQQVKAVVIETTGDISVLHGDKLEGQLLQGVSRYDG